MEEFEDVVVPKDGIEQTITKKGAARVELEEVKKGFKGMGLLEKVTLLSLLSALFFIVIQNFIALFWTSGARVAAQIFGAIIMAAMLSSVVCFVLHCIKNKEIKFDGTLMLFAITLVCACL